MPEPNSTLVKPPRILSRIVSIDIFRGLNIALMIFVNELAGIGGLPWWTHHAPAAANVMTYVDMVFPGFLIIIGLSLPLAFQARARRGDNTAKLILYILLRSLALIVLGLILENGQQASAPLMHGLGNHAWTLLALLAAFLIWMDYPRTEAPHRLLLYKLLRLAGIAALVALAALYRRLSPETHTTSWLTFDYPEILGSIGYSYLVAGLCYLLTRRWLWAPIGWFAAFLTLNILSAAQLVNTHHPWWLWPIQNGSKPALIFAGVLISTAFLLEPRFHTWLRKAAPILAFGLAAAIAGWLLVPLGISKIRATPSWVLFNIAACCLLYSLLYYLCDVRKHQAWAAPFRSAGSNTLLTYLLPDLWYAVLGTCSITLWPQSFSQGAPGVLRAILFTILMLGLSALFTRLRIRLQL